MKSADIMEQAAQICAKSAADEWEVFSVESRRLSAEAKDGKIDALEVAESIGVSVRVRVKDRPGFSYSAEGSTEALQAMVDSAVAGAKSADPDKYGAFADHGGSLPQLDLWDPSFDKIDEKEKIARAVELEKAGKEYDKRVARVRSATYGEGSRTVRIINSRGLAREARANGCSASVMAVAEGSGQSQYGWDYAYSPTWDGLDVVKVGRGAAADAVDMLGAEVIPTVQAPVILRNTAASELLSVLGNSFLGESVAKGKSMLTGKLDKKIFSDLISVYDDGLLKGGPATFPFDGEGTPRRTTALVGEGKLANYLYDLQWGRKADKPSTGNSGRGGYTSPPMLGLSNLYIPAGKTAPADMMKETGKALLVKELMGVHTANPVSGDFSLGASGTWIENGKPAHPVQGVTIAGNIIELFACVDAVGSDLKFVERVGAPSLRITCLSISGK